MVYPLDKSVQLRDKRRTELSSFSLVIVAAVDCCQLKCHPYYPTGRENEGDDYMEFVDVGLRVTYIEEKESNVHYTARMFYITDTEVPNDIAFTAARDFR